MPCAYISNLAWECRLLPEVHKWRMGVGGPWKEWSLGPARFFSPLLLVLAAWQWAKQVLSVPERILRPSLRVIHWLLHTLWQFVVLWCWQQARPALVKVVRCLSQPTGKPPSKPSSAPPPPPSATPKGYLHTLQSTAVVYWLFMHQPNSRFCGSDIFGRLFEKNGLPYAIGPLCVLSVCNVGVLWPNGWMDQDETRHGGRPRPWPHCVRWGPSSPPKKGHRPQSLAHVCCGQTAGWIRMPFGREVGLNPGDIVLDGDPAPLPEKGHSSRPLLYQCPGMQSPYFLWLWAHISDSDSRTSCVIYADCVFQDQWRENLSSSNKRCTTVYSSVQAKVSL